jgi:DNA (cytosine-5)-methyltransferase 1
VNVLSLFAGIGGFEEAFSRCGVPAVASVECDAAARGVLVDRFPGTALMTDVTEVTGDDARAAGFDPRRGIVTAGWPCQGNSVAGRRGGMDDPRSGLWSHVVRLLAETRPRWFFGENVPGLLTVNGGRDFLRVVRDLDELGYGLAWRVLDAQFFGVPQRRRRVFIVGCLGDGAAPAEVLLEPEGRHRDPTALPAAGSAVAALTASGLGGGGPDDNLAQAGHVVPFDAAQITSAENRSNPQPGDPASSPAATGRSIRRLTPLECERLQGFPDQWTATSNGRPQSDSARYRQLGNSVAVPAVEWVARRITAHAEEVAA